MGKILFFDGICVMCNGLIGFALRHDKKHVFKFATLQGKTAARLIPEYFADSLKTVVLVDEKGIHTQSDAIIRLLMGLGGFFKLAILLKLAPKRVRDLIYNFIAHRRYRWFGTSESCALLTSEQKMQILD